MSQSPPPRAPHHNPHHQAAWLAHYRRQSTLRTGFRTVLHHRYAGHNLELDWYLCRLYSQDGILHDEAAAWQERQQCWPERDYTLPMYMLGKRIAEFMSRMAEVWVTGRPPRGGGRVDEDGRVVGGIWVGTEGCLEVGVEEDRRG